MGSGQAATLALSGASFSGPSSVPSIGDTRARGRAQGSQHPPVITSQHHTILTRGCFVLEVMGLAIKMQVVSKFNRQ